MSRGGRHGKARGALMGTTAPVASPPFRPDEAEDLLLATAGEVLDGIGSGNAGLTSAEARARLSTYGPNALDLQRRSTLWSAVFRQLTHPLALLLWVAAILAA